MAEIIHGKVVANIHIYQISVCRVKLKGLTSYVPFKSQNYC